MKIGLALVPESRKEEALFLQQSVQFNTTIKVLDGVYAWCFCYSSKEIDIAQNLVDDMSIKLPVLVRWSAISAVVISRRSVIGRVLATAPNILYS
jgi:ribose transport system ATP-binding protein